MHNTISPCLDKWETFAFQAEINQLLSLIIVSHLGVSTLLSPSIHLQQSDLCCGRPICAIT